MRRSPFVGGPSGGAGQPEDVPAYTQSGTARIGAGAGSRGSLRPRGQTRGMAMCMSGLLLLAGAALLLIFSFMGKDGGMSSQGGGALSSASSWGSGAGLRRFRMQLQPDAMHPGSRFIPKVVHMAMRKTTNPRDVRLSVASWRQLNPGWEVRVYNDTQMADYVAERFPQYRRTYRALGRLVEKADLFRYLVLLKEGGVYADLDVECHRALDDYLPSLGAGLVVGWEREGVPPPMCARLRIPRVRPLVQYTIASVSGHPALAAMADWVAHHANGSLAVNAARDSEERTGRAAFTDVVVEYARANPPGKGGAWPVTFLPRAVWGVRVANTDDTVLRGAGRRGEEPVPDATEQYAANLANSGPNTAGADGDFGSCPPLAQRRGLWPVSVQASSPFTLFTHLPWQGASDAGEPASKLLSAYGNLQPGLHPTDQPSALDVLALLMKQALAPGGRPGALIDIGASYGLYSLATAAQGYRVVSFVKAGGRSVPALEHSVRYNGLSDAVAIMPVQLAQSVRVLRLPSSKPSKSAAAAAAMGASIAARRLLQSSAGDAGDIDGPISADDGIHGGTDGGAGGRAVLQSRASGLLGDGGGEAATWAVPEHDTSLSGPRYTPRLLEQYTLGSLRDALKYMPENLPPVRVVRASANGWEPTLLDALLDALPSPPDALLLTWSERGSGAEHGGLSLDVLLARLGGHGYDSGLVASPGCCKGGGKNASALAAEVAREARALGAAASVSWCDVSGAALRALAAPARDDVPSPPPARQLVLLHRGSPLAARARRAPPACTARRKAGGGDDGLEPPQYAQPAGQLSSFSRGALLKGGRGA